jgi:hypothetical protein
MAKKTIEKQILGRIKRTRKYHDILEAVNKGIDKAIEAYTNNGKLVVEDWDMFDQDMRHYMESELKKR